MRNGEVKIDFVIPWVDGSDPAWRAEFLEYRSRIAANPSDDGGGEVRGATDASEERYRDWDTLRYWFRGVERFAPWVNRIHFITWGHLPAWLDTDHPKLHVVRHADYIPSPYLPTFSSCPIELNMHRIEGLEEHFVYFNDDTFLCGPVGPERFFRDGLPRDAARLAVIPAERVGHNILECLAVINRRYDKREVLRRHAGKWFDCRYRLSDMLKTLTLLPWRFFPGFRDFHMPQPFLRRTFERLWCEEAGVLDATCRSRFRSATDLSQWVMRYEQLAAGEFVPVGMGDTGLATLSEAGMPALGRDIRSGKYAMVCINDSNAICDTEFVRRALVDIFDNLLPEKSAYER